MNNTGETLNLVDLIGIPFKRRFLVLTTALTLTALYVIATLLVGSPEPEPEQKELNGKKFIAVADYDSQRIIFESFHKKPDPIHFPSFLQTFTAPTFAPPRAVEVDKNAINKQKTIYTFNTKDDLANFAKTYNNTVNELHGLFSQGHEDQQKTTACLPMSQAEANNDKNTSNFCKYWLPGFFSIHGRLEWATNQNLNVYQVNKVLHDIFNVNQESHLRMKLDTTAAPSISTTSQPKRVNLKKVAVFALLATMLGMVTSYAAEYYSLNKQQFDHYFRS